MRLLFVTTVLPGAAPGGGELVTDQVVEALRVAGADVRVIGYRRPGEAAKRPDDVAIEERPIETTAAGPAAAIWMAQALVRRRAYSMAKYTSPAAAPILARELAQGAQGIVVEHLQAPWHQLPATARDLPLVFVAHNVEADLYRALSVSAADPLRRWLHSREARYVDRAERELVHRADQTWALTVEDRDALAQAAPGADVRALEVPSSLQARTGSSLACDVAAIGSWSWRANAAGLRWFADAVVPLLPPHVTVRVAGRGADWLRGVRPNLMVDGFVPDAAQFLAGARVVAVPSRAGAGIQVKLLDAIATGRPVVATPTAARGLERLPRTVHLTDDATAFAAALERLAASGPTDPDPEALAWTQARRERFRASVATWLAELAPGRV